MPAGKRAFLQGVAFWGVVLGLCYLGLRYALPCFLPLVLGAIMAAALHPAAAGLCRRLGWRYRPCAVLVAVAALTLLGLMLWGIGGVVVRQGSALLPQIPAFYRETLLPLAEELREKWQTLQQGRAGGGWRDLPGGGAAKRGDHPFAAGGGLAGGHCFLAAVDFIHHDLYGAFHHLLFAGLCRDHGIYCAVAAGAVAAAYGGIQAVPAGGGAEGAVCLPVHHVHHLWGDHTGTVAAAGAVFCGHCLCHCAFGYSAVYRQRAVFDPVGAYHLLISRQTALGAGLLLLYAVVTVVRMWLEPRIVGGRIGLHPLATLTAMYAGLKIFGFWGLLLAPLGTTLLLHLRQGGYLRGEG